MSAFDWPSCFCLVGFLLGSPIKSLFHTVVPSTMHNNAAWCMLVLVVVHVLVGNISVLNKFCKNYCFTKFKHKKYTSTIHEINYAANFTKLKLVKYFAHASLLPTKYSQSTVSLWLSNRPMCKALNTWETHAKFVLYIWHNNSTLQVLE